MTSVERACVSSALFVTKAATLHDRCKKGLPLGLVFLIYRKLVSSFF